ncbi:MAG: aspartate carbamoyltransferase catalytic subunit [Parvularculaceae bacterium]|nr:aspartate carbamoyltransferase catalytic subunit [Parvularculaceae bacterium]
MEFINRPYAPAGGFAASNLINIDDFPEAETNYVLDLAEYYARFLKAGKLPPARLAGKTQINLFFEDSTRTNLSFELAGRRLGADVLSVPVAASSVNKGESLIDTTQTLVAMGAHALIVRHREPRVHDELAKRIACPVINAGDGVREHPTQALLDAATIRSVYGTLKGLVIAICGDVKHSRVAASGAVLFSRLGAEVRFVGPAHLMPAPYQMPQARRFDTLADGIAGADIVMALRMQFERMEEGGKDAATGYFETYGLTHDTLKLAKPDARVMHPGPMNRGVEIDGALADDERRSLILKQVFYGVATRMAVLDALITKGAAF